MLPFEYTRLSTIDEAIAVLATSGSVALAGGTDVLNLLRCGALSASKLVDIASLPMTRIDVTNESLAIGSLARLADVAADESIAKRCPVIRGALLNSASQQIRTMATVGGNLLQGTRCPYFRSGDSVACNRRNPGSGCSANQGDMRNAAIMNWTRECRATHPSDLAVALASLDAMVVIRNAAGSRNVPLHEFYMLPALPAYRDNILKPGEMIVEISVPLDDASEHSIYLKVRERSSYEFALVSVAVAVSMEAGRIKTIRVACGGISPIPLRLPLLETQLVGRSVDAATLQPTVAQCFANAVVTPVTQFKVQLAINAVIRAVTDAAARV